MKLIRANLKLVVGAALCVALMPLWGMAQQGDERDPAVLLEQLQDTDPSGAARIERQLMALWSQSGSAAMDMLLRRGQDAIERGDFTTAIEHLTALTDHAPEFAEGWHARAMAFANADLYAPALADLERALGLNSDHYDALYGLGTLLELFEKPRAAYDAYAQVLARNPHHSDSAEAMDRLRAQIEGKAL